MAKFNFKATFDKIGKNFVQYLSKGVKQGKGIDGANYSLPAPSTLKKRFAQRGAKRTGTKFAKGDKTSKGLASSTKRLWVTGEFGNEAFGYKPTENGVKIFAREVSHKDGISYAQILRYNSRGQTNLNRHIKMPPLVFPTDKNEIAMMSDPFTDARRIFEKEANKQMREQLNTKMKVVLRIG